VKSSIRRNNRRETEAISAKLPNFWVSYLIAALLLIGEILQVIIKLISVKQRTYLIISPIGLAGWIYWFICIYQMHKVLAELTNSAYPITPVAAVGYHFIPLYNVYWIFKWPAEIAKFVNSHLGRKAASKDTGIFLFLAPFLVRIVGAGIPLIVVFSVGLYSSRNILQVIEKSNKIPRQQVIEETGEFH
jgi:hypothetical protein